MVISLHDYLKKTGHGTFMRINLKNPAKAVIPLQPISKFVNKTIKNIRITYKIKKKI